MKQHVLPNRAHPQPARHVVPGGDCGACALGGIFPIALRNAYALAFDHPKPFGHLDLVAAAKRAVTTGLATDCVTRIPHWELPESLRTWGNPSWAMNDRWFLLVDSLVRRGFYAVTNVSLEKKGPLGGDTDHVVLICGTREREDEKSTALGRPYVVLRQEILVSCSVRGEEWVEVRELLTTWGGFNFVAIKPKERE